jgi:hypothetical protein
MADRLTKAPPAPLDAVEWRIQGSIDKGGGANVCAYLDAPTVAELLDDWVGPENWRDLYTPIGPETAPTAMWCHLSVRVPGSNDDWVTKSDLGVPSNMEAAKGLVSDAFKRVAMRKWGVGRNVCALPVLRVTRLETWEKNGKTQGRLTAASHAQIEQLLRAKGLAELADHVRISDVAEGEAEAVQERSHQSLLDELSGLYNRLPVDRQAKAATWIESTYGCREWEDLTVSQLGAVVATLHKAVTQHGSARPSAPYVTLSRADYAKLSAAGIGDALRHELCVQVTGDRSRSSKQLTAVERDALLGWAERIIAGELRVVDPGPDGGTALFDANDQLVISAPSLEALA